MRTFHGGRGWVPPQGVVRFHGLALPSNSTPSQASGSSWSSGSHHVRKLRDDTTSAPAFVRSRPAPPKWSTWLWVTTTVCTFRTANPAAANRASIAFHDFGPGRPGSTTVHPRESSRA